MTMTELRQTSLADTYLLWEVRDSFADARARAEKRATKER